MTHPSSLKVMQGGLVTSNYRHQLKKHIHTEIVSVTDNCKIKLYNMARRCFLFGVNCFYADEYL